MRCLISKQIKFHMGHRVPFHKSKCRSMHGHTYLLTAYVVGTVDQRPEQTDEGMVMDFGDIKTILMDKIYNRLDHASMLWVGDPLSQALRNDKHTRVELVPFIPTAENIARWCFDEIAQDLYIPRQRRLLRVRINETPTSTAEYSAVMDGVFERALFDE